jgi:hypothetical protein
MLGEHEILRSLARIERMLNQLLTEEAKTMAAVADIQAEVTSEQTVDAGLLVLINQLIANQNDPAALSALLANMKANIAPLSAALTANTPQATS